MTVYKWHSETLSEYTQGLIIVSADSVEDARVAVIKSFFSNDSPFLADDEDALLRISEDILNEPELVENSVVWIWGCD